MFCACVCVRANIAYPVLITIQQGSAREIDWERTLSRQGEDRRVTMLCVLRFLPSLPMFRYYSHSASFIASLQKKKSSTIKVRSSVFPFLHFTHCFHEINHYTDIFIQVNACATSSKSLFFFNMVFLRFSFSVMCGRV